MRTIARVLVSVILIAFCSRNLAAADTGSSWWPFGHHDDAKVAQPPVAAAPSTLPLQTPRPSSTTAQPSATTLPGLTSSAPVAHQAQMPSTSADAAAKEHWMLSSPKGKVSWPHLTKPHLPETGVFAKKPEADATRNSWADTTPIAPKPSPLKPITDGAHKVTKSTKAAWHKTVDALTPGEPAPAPRSNGSSRIAKQEIKPPFWKRMLGEKQELQQPQTVPEWMAQQRLDPSPSQTR